MAKYRQQPTTLAPLILITIMSFGCLDLPVRGSLGAEMECQTLDLAKVMTKARTKVVGSNKSRIGSS